MPTERSSEHTSRSGDSLNGYAAWEAAVFSEQRFLRRTRRILIFLMAVFLISFIGARLTGGSESYHALLRSTFGISAATTFLIGAALVIFGVHRTPRVASFFVMFAGILLFGAETTKAILIFWPAQDFPVAGLIYGVADQSYFASIIITMGILNLALFEMCARKMELVRETERTLFAQRMHEKSEKRYRSLFDAASDGILMLLNRGVIVEVNASACGFLGGQMEDLLGANIRDLLDGKVVDQIIHEDERALRDGKNLLEVHLQRKDGVRSDIELRVNPLPEGEILLLGRDITERKRIEAQLRQAQKMESVGRIAGGVAHDFNNALTPILGYADLLLDSMPTDDPRRAELTQIHKAAEHARDLTRQLLAFSRKQVLDMKVVDLNHVVSTFRDVIRRSIREDIAIHVKLDPELGNFKADAFQIEQILMNLAVNAQDSMSNGGTMLIETGNVELDAAFADSHPGSQPGPHVALIVSDAGMGMSQEALQRVFDPFFTTKEHGTGLGLATVYGIVKQHGGSIWMYSEEGKGTTCKAYFPRVDEPTARRIAPVSSRMAESRGETVLVVEDNDAVRGFVRATLERYGYTVVDTGEPAEGLRLIAENLVAADLVLTDVIMPEMNGRELFTRLAELRPGLKVLYMSGYTDNVIEHHGVLAEGVDLIQKPIAPEALARKVREILDR